MSDAIEELARDLWDAWQATVGCPESARGISWETIREGAGRANAAGQRYHAMALSEAATLVTLGYRKVGPDHVVVPREPTEADLAAVEPERAVWGTILARWREMVSAFTPHQSIIKMDNPVRRETLIVQAEGRRRYRRNAQGLCANGCGRDRREHGPYCQPCTNAYESKRAKARTKEYHALKNQSNFKAVEGEKNDRHPENE